jgi:hypothetical protein
LCARQGAFTWRCKSSTGRTGGTVSRTARVSIARWNLKEAAGKAPARRTEIAYEAAMPDEKANIFKVRYLYGRHGRKRTYTRARNLMKQGLSEERAWKSATNGRGPWWNSGASHMNRCFPKSFFDRLGLVSLLDQLRRLQCSS